MFYLRTSSVLVYQKRSQTKTMNEDENQGDKTLLYEGLDGGGGVLYSLFIKKLVHYSSH